MAEPEGMILPLLREMRAEMNTSFERIDKRLEALEKAQNSFRQALTADSLLSKLVTGEFEERIGDLERRLKTIESLERRVRELETQR